MFHETAIPTKAQDTAELDSFNQGSENRTRPDGWTRLIGWVPSGLVEWPNSFLSIRSWFNQLNHADSWFVLHLV